VFDGAFRSRFDKFADKIPIEYVYQEVNIKVKGLTTVERTKPWGTSHAVLVAKDVINEPFAVINADDYYGAGSFQLIADFLTNDCSPSLMAMVGYTLHNTLSEYGTVNRGVCEVDNKNNFVQQFLFFQLPQLSCFYDLPHTLLY
jgi:UTP-glucose-1-phosphate uridylyltransferase